MLRSRLVQELHFGLMEDSCAGLRMSEAIGPFLRRLADSLSPNDRCWLRLCRTPRWRSPEVRRIDCGGWITGLAVPRNPVLPPMQPGWIAVETLFDRVTIWNLDSRRRIGEVTGTLPSMEAKWDTIWHRRDFDPDDKRLQAPHDSRIAAGIDPDRKRIVVRRRLGPDSTTNSFEFSEGAVAVRWLESSPWLLSLHTDGHLRAWDLELIEVEAEETGHRSPFEEVVWAPDGLSVYIRAHHENLALWKIEGSVERIPFHDARAAWGPDSNELWIGDDVGHTRFSRLDLERSTTNGFISKGDRLDKVVAIAFELNTRRIAVGTASNGRINLSAWQTSRPGRFRWNLAPSIRRLWSLERRGYEVDTLAWQPESSTGLLAASIDGRPLLLDGRSGRHVNPLSLDIRKTSLVRLFGATIIDGESFPQGDLLAYVPTADFLVWHPNGQWLAAVSLHGNLAVWDTKTGEAAFSWQVEEAGVCPFLSVTWIQGTQWLVTGSGDGWLRVWNGMTGDCLAGCDCNWPVKGLWSDPENQGHLRVVVEINSGEHYFPDVLHFALEPGNPIPIQHL